MLVLSVCWTGSVNAQGDDEPEVPFETRVYNVGDLFEAPSMLSEVSSKSQKQNTLMGGFGGVAGGEAGGMGGGMGGGGMFNVPDNVLPQFGGGGMGGMGGGMMGGGGAVTIPDRMTREALETVLYDHLSDDDTEWEQMSGSGGKLSIVGSMLIVTHTAAVHDRVGGLLQALRQGGKNSPNVQVDVRVVEIASEQGTAAVLANAETIEKLASDPSAARLTIRCGNNRVATVSSGLRRSYVVSLTPVVGSNGAIAAVASRDVAYRPETASLLLGMFGRIKPEIEEDQKSGRLHLGIRLASGPEEVVSATFGTGQSIDRVELETAELETAIVTPAETWTLAGNVAVTDPTSKITSGAALPHLAVLVRWKVVQ